MSATSASRSTSERSFRESPPPAAPSASTTGSASPASSRRRGSRTRDHRTRPQEGTRMTNSAAPVSFEAEVRPLFSERDRESMEFAFDLWSYDDVSENADAILA